jgi:hypothetical protein
MLIEMRRKVIYVRVVKLGESLFSRYFFWKKEKIHEKSHVG